MGRGLGGGSDSPCASAVATVSSTASHQRVRLWLGRTVADRAPREEIRTGADVGAVSLAALHKDQVSVLGLPGSPCLSALRTCRSW